MKDAIRTNYIEKAKNIILVVLVFTTILLLYFLWNDRELVSVGWLEGENYESYEHKEYKEADLILPDDMIFSLGNGTYMKPAGEIRDIWAGQFLTEINVFSAAEEIVTEEITAEQYEEAFGYPSVKAVFNYDIPINEYFELVGITENRVYDSISNFTEIGFSDASLESLFIYDAERQRYWRLIGIAPEAERFYKTIEATNVEFYYELGALMGETSDNSVLTPIDTEIKRSKLYIGDLDVKDDTEVDYVAQSFFGEGFDFVRKIEEAGGRIVFMYGYGEKLLMLSPESVVEYSEELQINSESSSIISDLNIALDFISAHGGFISFEGDEFTPYISYMERSHEGVSTFEFSIEIEGEKLYYEQYAPIVTEVTEGQVTYFRRNLFSIEDNEQNIAVKEESEENLQNSSAINVLAQNFEYIKQQIITAETASTDIKNLSFEEVIHGTQSLEKGYIKTAEGDNSGQLIPVWILNIQDVELYFDMETMAPIKHE